MIIDIINIYIIFIYTYTYIYIHNKWVDPKPRSHPRYQPTLRGFSGGQIFDRKHDQFSPKMVVAFCKGNLHVIYVLMRMPEMNAFLLGFLSVHMS